MQAAQLCELFEKTFLADYDTRLAGGADEPCYQPGNPSMIIYRSDYASSALHEVAHWCLAGAARRAKPDYGYWYASSRGPEAQRLFELVEARPQALEWIFSEAAGVAFRVSADNFDEASVNTDDFRRQVRAAVKPLLTNLPGRARQFAQALIAETGHCRALAAASYELLPR